MKENAVNPAKLQRYLSRWASWWTSVIKLDKMNLIYRWVVFTTELKNPCVWLGRGLLLGSPLLETCLNTPYSNQIIRPCFRV